MKNTLWEKNTLGKYALEKDTLEKYTLEKYTFRKYTFGKNNSRKIHFWKIHNKDDCCTEMFSSEKKSLRKYHEPYLPNYGQTDRRTDMGRF